MAPALVPLVPKRGLPGETDDFPARTGSYRLAVRYECGTSGPEACFPWSEALRYGRYERRPYCFSNSP